MEKPIFGLEFHLGRGKLVFFWVFNATISPQVVATVVVRMSGAFSTTALGKQANPANLGLRKHPKKTGIGGSVCESLAQVPRRFHLCQYQHTKTSFCASAGLPGFRFGICGESVGCGLGKPAYHIHGNPVTTFRFEGAFGFQGEDFLVCGEKLFYPAWGLCC